MCTTPSFSPKGTWGEAAITVAKGMASIGAVELGASFGEPGVGVAGVVVAEGMVVEVGGAEGPALLAAPPRAKSPTNLACFSSVITMAAPEESKLKYA